MINIPYRVLIIDDEKPARILLEEYVSQIPELTVVGSFPNALQANEFLASNEADIILCDIQMPGLNGLEFIQAMDRDVCVIFTTAHSKFAVKGFELNAVDYLLKPIALERFRVAMDKCLKILHMKNPAPESLFVRADYKLYKIDLDEIVLLYIWAKNNSFGITESPGKHTSGRQVFPYSQILYSGTKTNPDRIT